MTMLDKSVQDMLNNNGDEPLSNHSANAHIDAIVQKRFSRRSLLQSIMGATAVTVMGANLTACGGDDDEPAAVAPTDSLNEMPRVGFSAIPTSRADTITLPAGYQWAPLVPWGTPITGSYPAYRDDGMNTGTEALQQMGMHHDGMHFFPINGSSTHGILCINHEYIDQNVLHAAGPSGTPRPQDEVLKEMAAHGVSVVEVQRSVMGGPNWEVVRGSYNRRITALTEMEITGPARGHAKMKTKFSTTGTLTRGTLNNCANGYTPWGTYLTAEENWAGYFANSDVSKPREHARYGVPSNGRYRWETATPALANDGSSRFIASVTGGSATEDYRNEPNTFGWIVEVDPFDPYSTPKKRTTLGRFGHEGVVFGIPEAGKPIVFYSGDDSTNEYIYKFVSKTAYQPGLRGDDLLNEGTLYVAKFNEDGAGEWLALDLEDTAFAAKVAAAEGTTVGSIAFDGFADQGDVLINTRLAADIAGATKMDRPEWGAVCPRTGMVYFTLTNNSGRGTADDANPRASNRTGHIIRWTEGTNNTFSWDIYLLAGGTTGALAGKVLPGTEREADLTVDNILASPDGLWFDDSGLMWIQTDMSGSQQAGTGPDGDFGNNQMLAAESDTGVIKRFLVGPKDAEVTGVVMTPDRKTMFVNIQHPGDRSTPGAFTSNFPANDGFSRPRSSTVVITRTDGGVIGQ